MSRGLVSIEKDEAADRYMTARGAALASLKGLSRLQAKEAGNDVVACYSLASIAVTTIAQILADEQVQYTT